VYHKIESQVLQPQPLNDVLIDEGGAAEPPEDKAVYENSFKTRANFTKKLGRDNIGKRLTVYARWVNISSPDKNGPYSATVSMVIS
jgi:hypothetical protein